MTPVRILLVDDEAQLAAGLKLNLELEGYAVDLEMSGKAAAARMLAASPYDLILLDVMLPDVDGFTLCRKIREAGNYTPVIMLTVRNTAEDRVLGLEAGADDYIAKPFPLAELLARVRSLLRRRTWERGGALVADSRGAANVLEFGDARVDFDSYTATAAGRDVQLTQLELELLRYFAQNSGRVISRDELLEKVWKLRHWRDTRTVDNFIVRLRRHFERDPAAPVHFLSVRGTGYRFVPRP